MDGLKKWSVRGKGGGGASNCSKAGCSMRRLNDLKGSPSVWFGPGGPAKGGGRANWERNGFSGGA